MLIKSFRTFRRFHRLVLTCAEETRHHLPVYETIIPTNPKHADCRLGCTVTTHKPPSHYALHGAGDLTDIIFCAAVDMIISSHTGIPQRPTLA